MLRPLLENKCFRGKGQGAVIVQVQINQYHNARWQTLLRQYLELYNVSSLIFKTVEEEYKEFQSCQVLRKTRYTHFNSYTAQ